MDLTPLHFPKLRILVLEEDPMSRAGLCSVLADAGYALADSWQATDRIDLVVASIRRRQGSKAALQLPDCAARAILLVDRTAWTGFDFFDMANDLGAVAVLQRPFQRSALLRLIADVLSEPRRATDGVEDAAEELPGLAELLISLDSPNFS